MIDAIRKFFGSSMQPPPDVEPDRAGKDVRLAACALLLEIAHADSEFTEEERRHLEAVMGRHFGLQGPELDELLELAESERSQAVDLWQFTKLISDNYSTGQKMVLAEAMWGLIYADGEMASKEEYLMRKIFSLLRLEPGYLAEARRRMEQGQDEGTD
jgi:uncharacterized tellurite resistance protein B-like protein